MDRIALADLLRSRRERLGPADVGLPPGLRRRTPGLRRDEVAALASISTDYYARLEQRRGPHPSPGVLSALARALRMTQDERDHLFHLADQAPPARHSTGAHVSPGVLYLLDRLDDTPAFVVDDLSRVVVQNRMSKLVSGDQEQLIGRERSHVWRWFTDDAGRVRVPEDDWDTHSRVHVADLRATVGHRGDDPDVSALVADLLEASPEFAMLWAQHEVAVRRSDHKRMLHPEVGLLDLLCEHLTSSIDGLTLVLLHPNPGSDCREKLDLLAVVGTQDLQSENADHRR
ncbi:helix-turn-helix protein [Antricoccus suffuscus]|uniref:Helix-turn-helix protein n=1 Tax=Antricoccus suffuscus TaxID=1629062 RepID=A0A2T0ZYV0_9ACTN|nr:helix-turn-helix transcriptional regulator [Antricoccus suffuscus]PRZ41530.1 helix-turn-helix protein [Antricoccus suffuscus]